MLHERLLLKLEGAGIRAHLCTYYSDLEVFLQTELSSLRDTLHGYQYNQVSWPFIFKCT